MSLHPSILFHFTGKESYEKILIDDFRPSYARERFDGYTKRKFGVPVVSFMDIKLSELKVHYDKTQDPKFKYGNYGIGLTKSWAIRQGVNPVFYLNSENMILNEFVEECLYLSGKLYKGDEFDSDLFLTYKKFSSMMCFMKSYKGILKRKDKPQVDDYMFADEKEWRWLPKCEPPLDIPLLVNYADLKETTPVRIDLDKRLDKIRLRFTPDDIKYLIVDSESDILPNHHGPNT